MTGQKLDSYLQLPKDILVLIFSLSYNLSFFGLQKLLFSPFHFHDHESSPKLISTETDLRTVLFENLSFRL